MKSVKWTDNVCTVGGTCIHGYFNHADLLQLLELCPEGDITNTFCCHELGMSGGKEFADRVKEIGEAEAKKNGYHPMHTHERGYYFTFMEKEGHKLMAWLKERYPMIRGEGCF